MFKPELQVFDKIDTISSYHGGLYMSDGYNFFRYSSYMIDNVVSIKDYWGFIVVPEGLWAGYGSRSEKCGSSTFIDIFQNGTFYPDLEFGLSDDDHISENEIIGVDTRFIYIVDRKTSQVLLKHRGRFNLGVVVKDDCIYVRHRNNGLICYDKGLCEKWHISFDKTCYTDIVKGPQGFDDLIIVNVGENTNAGRGDFELKAYSADDGSLKWQLMLAASPHSSKVIEDKVYVSVLDRIMVLNAKTGKTLLDVPHGFKGNSHHLLFPYKDKLIAFSTPDAKLHVFKENGILIQEISMPEGFTLGHYAMPVEHDGKLYVTLLAKNMLMRGTSSILLMLTPDETVNKKVQLELPPQPPLYISVVTTKEGEHEHVVSISHDNLDEIILYAIINLKQIGVETSSSIEMSKRDKIHNGKLHLVVDPEPLKEQNDLPGKLNIIKEKVEWYFESQYETAGDEERPYEVLIELK